MASAYEDNQEYKQRKLKCDTCSSDEEAREAIKAEKKVEHLKESIDTGQHPYFAEEKKVKPINEEDWRGYE